MLADRGVPEEVGVPLTEAEEEEPFLPKLERSKVPLIEAEEEDPFLPESDMLERAPLFWEEVGKAEGDAG
jgi:hypothetical protein